MANYLSGLNRLSADVEPVEPAPRAPWSPSRMRTNQKPRARVRDAPAPAPPQLLHLHPWPGLVPLAADHPSCARLRVTGLAWSGCDVTKEIHGFACARSRCSW